MSSDQFQTRNELIDHFSSLGVNRIYYKILQDNDNSKQQIYVGDRPGALAFLRTPWLPNKDESIPKLDLKLSWFNKASSSAAPHAKLIYYPDYPEVRLSGFLKGCKSAPRSQMQPIPRDSRKRLQSRVIFIGSTPDDSYFCHVSTAAWARELNEDADGTASVVRRLELECSMPSFVSQSERESVLGRDSIVPDIAEMISLLPWWASVALLARWCRRAARYLISDPNEPSSFRAAVADSIDVSVARASAGGAPEDWAYLTTGDAFHDNHDIMALNDALSSFVSSTSSTYEDLIGDRGIEEVAYRNHVATYASWTLLRFAFGDQGLTPTKPDLLEIHRLITQACPEETVDLNSDVRLAHELSNAGGWADTTAVMFPPIPAQVADTSVHFGNSTLKFRPRARIIRTIGDRLISGPEAAAIELVKNSYDADSDWVVIQFIPSTTTEPPAIVFSDNGHGMSFSDIQNKWMEPATSDKRDRSSSPRGRKLLGSKGIGRFAAARLGGHLRLESTKSVARDNSAIFEETIIPLLDWSVFDRTEYLDDVEFYSEVRESGGPSGTSLRITELRDVWSESSIKRLFHELRKLLSPINDESDDFKIILDLSLCTVENCGFDSEIIGKLSGLPVNNEVENGRIHIGPFPILSACDYLVDGIFDENGRFDGTFTILREGRAPEPISVAIPLNDQEQSCGIVAVNLSIFDREASSIRSTAQKAGFGHLGVREARRLLDAVAGIAIYRDKFRIRPYGDAENDWLTLDAKRVQNPSLKIGRNQVAGILLVENEYSAGLIERSSREGLEENGSFRRLQSLILGLLASEIEPRRRKYRLEVGLEKKKSTSFRDAIGQASMSWTAQILEQLPTIEREVAEKVIAHETGKLTGYLKELEERQAQLEAQVTLGLIVGEVMHQGNTPLAFIENETSRIISWWPSIVDPGHNTEYYKKEVPRILNGMEGSALALRTLFSALGPLAGARRGPPVSFFAADVINNTIYLFKSRADSLSVRFDIDFDLARIQILGYPQDLTTALTNLFDNSLHWLDYSKTKPGRISVNLGHVDVSTVCLIVSDNGPGVPDEFSDQLFEVGFSRKPNGTGLGLSIAREAIFRSGGELELSSGSTGAEFVLTLPLAT